MTLDEAIIHAIEVAELSKCEECKQDHLQLAEWLEKIKEVRRGILMEESNNGI